LPPDSTAKGPIRTRFGLNTPQIGSDLSHFASSREDLIMNDHFRCRHGVLIGWTHDDEAGNTNFCEDCAEEWQNGGRVEVTVR
jgi:hypothetical protein